ncbi:hypothetical protein NKH18_15160 [Streptomyces sp. M10(2022)]
MERRPHRLHGRHLPRPSAIPGALADDAADGGVTTDNSDWTLYDHHGKVISRSDSFPHPGGGDRLTRIVGTPGRKNHTTTWHDAADQNITGIRKTAYERQITEWGWDPESFQDFVREDRNPAGNQGSQVREGNNSERLVRDHQLLGDDASIDAWSVVGPQGNEIWHWNKTDRDGNILEFGNDVNDRVRHWYDANGTLLDRWAPGARWVDRVTSLGDRIIQETPHPGGQGGQPAPAVPALLPDDPFRVRDYSPTVDKPFDANVWQESDQGLIVHEKKRLPDGTFLETDTFNKQARRYGPDGVSLINDRGIAGYITDSDGTYVGRETHFAGILNEYRGLYRMRRETNRWEFGPSVMGESVYTPFAIKAIESVGIDMTQEWILDFVVGVVALALVRRANQMELTGMDVARAAFGATLTSVSKGVVASCTWPPTAAAGRCVCRTSTTGSRRTGLPTTTAGTPSGERTSAPRAGVAACTNTP